MPTSSRPGFSRTCGRARGPCPTKYVVVGRDPCVPPSHALLVMCHWRGNPYPRPKAPLPKGGWHGEAVTGGFRSAAHFLGRGIPLILFILSHVQGFPCEFFVIRATSAFFLLPNAPTCSKITLLTVLRVKLRSRSCAMDAHESCQAGNRAALRGIIHVPQGRRLCGFMGRTVCVLAKNLRFFCQGVAARCAHNFCAERKNSTLAG